MRVIKRKGNLMQRLVVAVCFAFVLLLFPSSNAIGQWSGADIPFFDARTVAARLSPEFRVQSERVLDFVDSLQSADPTDIARNREQRVEFDHMLPMLRRSARTRMDQILELDLERFYLEVNFGELYYLTLYGSNRDKLATRSPEVKSAIRYQSLWADMQKECTEDLRLRLHGDINRKCNDALQLINSTYSAGWIGAGNSTPGSRDAKPELTPMQKELIFRVIKGAEDGLQQIIQNGGKSRAADAVLDRSEEDLAQLKVDTFTALLFVQNLHRRLLMIYADSELFDKGAMSSGMDTYLDLTLRADKFCLEDIARRVEGSSEPLCQYATGELLKASALQPVKAGDSKPEKKDLN